jgi:hypothetical protein
MFTEAEKSMTSEQLYYVIQFMLAYEKQYNEAALISSMGESLNEYLIRAFNQNNHYNQLTLRTGLVNKSYFLAPASRSDSPEQSTYIL